MSYSTNVYWGSNLCQPLKIKIVPTYQRCEDSMSYSSTANRNYVQLLFEGGCVFRAAEKGHMVLFVTYGNLTEFSCQSFFYYRNQYFSDFIIPVHFFWSYNPIKIKANNMESKCATCKNSQKAYWDEEKCYLLSKCTLSH